MTGMPPHHPAMTAILVAIIVPLACSDATTGSSSSSGGTSSSSGGNSSGSSSGTGGSSGTNANDGATCSLGSSNQCSDACIESCGADPRCSELCCSTMTRSGISCSGACTDAKVDPENCGGCGKACAAEKLCSNAVCKNNCYSAATPAVEAACDDLCAKMSSSCAYGGFTWHGTGGGNFAWGGAAKCKQDCLAGTNGVCSPAIVALATCWKNGLTCKACSPGMCASGTTGAAILPPCAAEKSASDACFADCAP